jgi:ubiquinone/menaquinone biosynthesis C-methylase UbiE
LLSKATIAWKDNRSVQAHQLSKEEIGEKYDQCARYYMLVEGLPEMLGIRALRRDLVSRARGQMLEVAAGGGKNFRFLPDGIDVVVAGDISKEMLRIAQRKGRRVGVDAKYLLLDAENLPFPDDSFDTVLSTLSSCTFPDPIRAFREMSRVCRPDGRILLLEHGRSSVRLFGWYQDKRAWKQAEQFGCQWNREPVKLVQEAGLTLDETKTYFFDIFALMEARPAAA